MTTTTFFKLLNNSELMLDAFECSHDWLVKSCNTYSMNFVVVPTLALMPALVHKINVVFPSKRNVESILRAVRDHKCATLMAMPKLLSDVLSSPLLASYDTSSLRNVFSSSQIVSPDLVELTFAKLPQVRTFFVLYGMSEILNTTALTIERASLDHAGRLPARLRFCIGKPYSYLKCKVVEPATGDMVELNACGELYVKGFPVLDEYWRDQENTKQIKTHDGWSLKKTNIQKISGLG